MEMVANAFAKTGWPRRSIIANQAACMHGRPPVPCACSLGADSSGRAVALCIPGVQPSCGACMRPHLRMHGPHGMCCAARVGGRASREHVLGAHHVHAVEVDGHGPPLHVRRGLRARLKQVCTHPRAGRHAGMTAGRPLIALSVLMHTDGLGSMAAGPQLSCAACRWGRRAARCAVHAAAVRCAPPHPCPSARRPWAGRTGQIFERAAPAPACMHAFIQAFGALWSVHTHRSSPSWPPRVWMPSWPSRRCAYIYMHAVAAARGSAVLRRMTACAKAPGIMIPHRHGNPCKRCGMHACPPPARHPACTPAPAAAEARHPRTLRGSGRRARGALPPPPKAATPPRTHRRTSASTSGARSD